MTDNTNITAHKAAERLGISYGRICQILRQDRIPGAHKPGGRDWQIPRAGLEAFAALERRGGRPRKEVEDAVHI